jgi:hypothetical protein
MLDLETLIYKRINGQILRAKAIHIEQNEKTVGISQISRKNMLKREFYINLLKKQNK